MEDTKLQQTKFSEQVNTSIDSIGKSVEEVVATSTSHPEQSALQVELIVQKQNVNSALSQ